MDRNRLMRMLAGLGGGSACQVLDRVERAMRERRGQLTLVEANGSHALDHSEWDALLDEEDGLGQVYQALNAPALESAYRATSRERRKFAHDEISTVSQLFTPRWVVAFLLQNTLGRLWLALHPDSRLAGMMDWQIALKCAPESAGLAQIQLAREIRLLDPACGTMNFGLVAYEMLHQMYEEELDRAGQPGWNPVASVPNRAGIPRAILGNNLFGIDIDPLALKLARATLRIKSGIDLPDEQWNLWQGDSLFDDAIDARCGAGFDVVATNPPYVSSRNLPAEQVARMKKRYPAAWRDLYACFIERSLDFCRPGGRVGLLVMQSFMFTGAYQKLRKRISRQAGIETLAHFGPGLFDIGNPGTLQTVAFTMRKEADEKLRAAQDFVAFRLSDASTEEKEAALRSAIGGHDTPASIRHACSQSALHDLPRRSWAYWVNGPIRRAFAIFPRLAQVSQPRQGLATTDNARFVRYWWEVEAIHPNSPLRATEGMWFPYAKSGQFRRWYESPRHRVNWLDGGREIKEAITSRYPYLKGEWRWVAKNTSYYGRPGITWSYLTSGRFSARRLEAGAIFDVAGSSLFPADIPGMLAILNSSAVHRLLGAINPTVNFQVGDLAELPVPAKIPSELARLAEAAIRIQQQVDTSDETAPDFVAPMPWNDAVEQMHALSNNLAQIERESDLIVSEIYGFAPEPDDPLKMQRMDTIDLAKRWISHAIGVLLGRWNGGASRRVLQLDPIDPQVVTDIHDIVARLAGEVAVGEIAAQVGGIERFLAGEFYRWHVRLYRQRPPYWGFRAGGKLLLLAHESADRETILPILRQAGVSLPGDWRRNLDEGIQPGLTPLCDIVADPVLRKVLEKLARENQ